MELFLFWYLLFIKVPHSVRNTSVRILGVKQKTKLWSMYLYFVIVSFYTVGLFIYNISFFGKKYKPVFLDKICDTYLLSKYFRWILSNFISLTIVFRLKSVCVLHARHSKEMRRNTFITKESAIHVKYKKNWLFWN
jgi:hypothetical protein